MSTARPDEPPGKTGLGPVQHLMFQGIGKRQGRIFPFRSSSPGATEMRTAPPLVMIEPITSTKLFLPLRSTWRCGRESGSHGALAGRDRPGPTDQQRGVAQNEKREDENQPDGGTTGGPTNAFPANHPYHSYETVGSMADLNAASSRTSNSGSGQYYGAANATIALVGDITPVIARRRRRSISVISHRDRRSPRLQPRVAPRNTSSATTTHDEVAQTRIIARGIPQLRSRG